MNTQKRKFGGAQPGAGRKKMNLKNKTFGLAVDVIEMLDRVKNKSAYVNAAIREKYARDFDQSK